MESFIETEINNDEDHVTLQEDLDNLQAWAYRAGGGGGGGAEGAAAPPSLLGKQSQPGNIRFTVGQCWLIIKINGTNSVNFVGNSVNFVGNMLSNRNFS